MSPKPTPAEQLLGRHLDGGWTVVSVVQRPIGATGGFFSRGYLVESEHGDRGYLKALDFRKPFSGAHPVDVMHEMTQAFKYERDICARCAKNHLDRVVKAITDGSIQTDPSDPWTIVPYLVFELADRDIRAALDATMQFDNAWALRTIHNVATGLKQLHSIGVAHQDLKPSNVLMFSRTGAKIGDLGRCISQLEPSPHDDRPWCGDRDYAPPELRYGYVESDWRRRRFGCDAYLLGSMIQFMFDRVGMTATLFGYMRPEHHPKQWNGTYEDVLPYLQAAFGHTLNCFASYLPRKLRTDLIELLRELCEPDPRLRGDRSRESIGQSPFSMERYVSRFDLLSRRVEAGYAGYCAK
jgi:serine/threonine protein kinase